MELYYIKTYETIIDWFINSDISRVKICQMSITQSVGYSLLQLSSFENVHVYVVLFRHS
jgi:hypothetical protein